MVYKVSIVGRPNVGKSTLFNKLTNSRKAITDQKFGVTRDRIYGDVEWNGKKFKLIDTGGIDVDEHAFQMPIKIQAEIAIEESDLILFVLDGRNEISNNDMIVSQILKNTNKKVLVLINKLDNYEDFDPHFWKLNWENYFSISSIHGNGLGDVLDLITKEISDEYENESDKVNLAIIGRPNVGKSTLLNTLTNKQRAVVSPIANTTRDSVDDVITINESSYRIVDTAGINRKSKLIESVEHYALQRAFDSLDESNIAIFVNDFQSQISHFDLRIAGYAFERKKPFIFVINKWDVKVKDKLSKEKFSKLIRKKYQFLTWAPIVFISAKEKIGINELKKEIDLLKSKLELKISSSKLNQVINEIQILQPPPSFKGGRLNITYAKQIKGKIPTFVFYINNQRFLHFSYQRYIENKLRTYFDLRGTPIKVNFHSRKK